MKTILSILLMLTSIVSTSQSSNDTTVVEEDLDCQFSKNEVDDFTGDKKVVHEPQDWVAHTDSSLMKYYKKKKYDYLEIEAMCARINETSVVYFMAKIRSSKAYKYYGSIYKDSKILIKLSNGEMLELVFDKTTTGDTNYDLDYTTYSTYSILTDEQVNILTENSIDKIRWYWSKGYEDYDVDNSECIKNQFKCINKEY